MTSALLAAFVLAAVASPNDPHFGQQWGLQLIGAPEAWESSRGEGVIVAVLDSGVAMDHPDLVGAFVRGPDGRILGRDFVDGDADPTDEHGHGTMVAGIIAARTGNGVGVASVAPESQLLPVRVLDDRAVGRSVDVDAGIRWAVDNGAAVINLSLEVARRDESELSGVRRQAPDDAVRYAWEHGVVVVAAAGNDSSDFTDYPDDSPILLVGATDENDVRAVFSDSGRSDMLMAPGVGIVSTWCDPCGMDGQQMIGQASGTSYAAAHVSGAVAVLIAAGVDPREAVEILRETAVDLGEPGPDALYGFGRIDLPAALRHATVDVGAADDQSPTSAEPDDTEAPGDGEQPASSPAGDVADATDSEDSAEQSAVSPAPVPSDDVPDSSAVGADGPRAGTTGAAGLAAILIAFYAAAFTRWRRTAWAGGRR
jgi:serine protease